MKFDKIRQFRGGYTVSPITLKIQPQKTERCILCSEDTGVSCDTPIAAREHYIYGCGQLCERCYTELYNSKTEDTGAAQENEMKKLIEMCKEKK